MATADIYDTGRYAGAGAQQQCKRCAAAGAQKRRRAPLTVNATPVARFHQHNRRVASLQRWQITAVAAGKSAAIARRVRDTLYFIAATTPPLFRHYAAFAAASLHDCFHFGQFHYFIFAIILLLITLLIITTLFH
jgi:hypothetical protein